jgi:hypothetical protein
VSFANTGFMTTLRRAVSHDTGWKMGMGLSHYVVRGATIMVVNAILWFPKRFCRRFGWVVPKIGSEVRWVACGMGKQCSWPVRHSPA